MPRCGRVGPTWQQTALPWIGGVALSTRTSTKTMLRISRESSIESTCGLLFESLLKANVSGGTSIASNCVRWLTIACGLGSCIILLDE